MDFWSQITTLNEHKKLCLAWFQRKWGCNQKWGFNRANTVNSNETLHYMIYFFFNFLKLSFLYTLKLYPYTRNPRIGKFYRLLTMGFKRCCCSNYHFKGLNFLLCHFIFLQLINKAMRRINNFITWGDASSTMKKTFRVHNWHHPRVLKTMENCYMSVA